MSAGLHQPVRERSYCCMQDGNKRVDLKSLHRFILETARTGGLPKGRSKEHHLYFLAREKLRVEGSEKFVYGA